jgi:hypothetical protein
MKNIILKNIVKNTSSNDEGQVLFDSLKDAYFNGLTILLTIDSNQAMSSSFLNTSIGKFLEEYGFEQFKKTVKFKGTKSQFQKLSKYISNYKNIYLESC